MVASVGVAGRYGLLDGRWTWSGPHARATGVLSEDGRAMPTLHEWSDDGVNWRPSMDVTLRKVV
jgi:hypothetical protein